MIEIEYSPKFAKTYKKLPAGVKKIAVEKEKIFRRNPFDKRLKTHKLSGRLEGYWSFSISYKYRIIFSFVNEKLVRFHTVGGHAIYRQ